MVVRSAPPEVLERFCKCGAHLTFTRELPLLHCYLCGRKVKQ